MHKQAEYVSVPLLYEGLLRSTGTSRLIPCYARDLKKMRAHILLYINTDARFSDGSGLTAYDVKYSLEFCQKE